VLNGGGAEKFRPYIEGGETGVEKEGPYLMVTRCERRNLVSVISERTATMWAGMVAGTVFLVVAMALVSGHSPAGAQSEEDALTGPTLQFGCNVLKVAGFANP
jgi:hypothetical protein